MVAGCYPYASGGEASGTSSPLFLAGRITRSGACWFPADHHIAAPALISGLRRFLGGVELAYSLEPYPGVSHVPLRISLRIVTM